LKLDLGAVNAFFFGFGGILSLKLGPFDKAIPRAGGPFEAHGGARVPTLLPHKGNGDGPVE
jgi:hypothetical protein